MYNLVILIAIVASASAFPVDTTTENFMKTVINNHLEAKQKTADLVKSAVSKFAGLGNDGVDVASSLSKAGVKLGIELAIKGTTDMITLATQFTDLARQFTKHIPMVNGFVQAGTQFADQWMLVGLYSATIALKVADELSEKGINAATGVAKTSLDIVDKSVATGSTIFKNGVNLFKME